MRNKKELILAFMVSPESKYFNSFLENRQDIFMTPLKLYNYFTRKAQLKIVDVKTIVIVFSEFDKEWILPPGTDFGPISWHKTYFDFEALNSIFETKNKSLFFLEFYQSAIERLNVEFEWKLEATFKYIYADTIDCLKSGSYPTDFEADSILLGF